MQKSEKGWPSIEIAIWSLSTFFSSTCAWRAGGISNDEIRSAAAAAVKVIPLIAVPNHNAPGSARMLGYHRDVEGKGEERSYGTDRNAGDDADFSPGASPLRTEKTPGIR